jgi:hypothetical protein
MASRSRVGNRNRLLEHRTNSDSDIHEDQLHFFLHRHGANVLGQRPDIYRVVSRRCRRGEPDQILPGEVTNRIRGYLLSFFVTPVNRFGKIYECDYSHLLTSEKDLLMAKITDAPRAGLISLSLPGALPETYFCSNLDEYEAVMAAALADDGMSPPDRAGGNL